MKILIIGGTGVISRGIVGELLAKSHDVTIFNRGNKNLHFSKDVKQITGNRLDREDFEKRMKKSYYDVVIDMICFNTDDAKSTVKAFLGNAGQIIVCSSIAAYRRPYNSLPTEEDMETLADNPVYAYSFNKAEVERYLNKLYQDEKLPVTIFRPSLTYGAGAGNIGVLRQNYGIVKRIMDGKPLVMFGDGTTPWSFTFVPDLARGVAGLAGNKDTYGQAYHITSEYRNTWEDLYLEFGRLIGKKPVIRHIPSELLYRINPDLFTHIYFEKSYAGIFDNSKIRKAVPGFKAEISLHEGLKTILEWFEKEASEIDEKKDAFEDGLVGMYDSWNEQIKNLYF